VKRDWTKRKRRLDDCGRNDRRQAVRRSICNAPARVCVVVLALAGVANLYVGSAQAAGDSGPGDLSAQIDGIVTSALAVAEQPLNGGPVSADSVVNQAMALAQKAAADATSTASTLAPQSAGAELPISQAPAPADSARERTPPARLRPALDRKRQHAAVRRPKTRGVVSTAWYDRPSPSAVGPTPVGRTRTAKAPPRPERSAAPRWPRPPGPMPPRPDASSPGQSGGQGTSVPSLLAAVSGLLIIFGFHCLPRLLPLLAFRKPRRIVLPSWHPG
jgi:hypothetical protein